MNRQTRRHPTHFLLPIQYASKRRILNYEWAKPCGIPKGSRQRRNPCIIPKKLHKSSKEMEQEK